MKWMKRLGNWMSLRVANRHTQELRRLDTEILEIGRRTEEHLRRAWQNADERHKRVHVLLVENDTMELRLLTELINESRLPIQVRHVGSGEVALACLRRERPWQAEPLPDYVFLDETLPGMSGWETYAEILGDAQQIGHVTVVMMTASAEPRSYPGALMVRKPMTADALQAIVSAG